MNPRVTLVRQMLTIVRRKSNHREKVFLQSGARRRRNERTLSCITPTILILACLFLLTDTTGSAQEGSETEPFQSTISFSRDVAPILLERCIACHGEKRNQGDYQVTNYQTVFQSGESEDTPVKPGDLEASYLWQLVTDEDDDLRMPKEKDRLTSSELDVLRQWIEEGAKFDGVDPQQGLRDLAPPRDHRLPPKTYRAALPVTALAFHPDGSQIAVGGIHEITLWDAQTGDLMRRIQNVAERTYALTYIENGAVIVAASGIPGSLGEVRAFQTDTGDFLREIVRMKDCALGLAVDPTQNRLAIAGADQSIRLIGWPDGVQQLAAQHHADWVYSVSFSPDGKRIVSASRDKMAKVIDTSTGDLLATYAGHNKPVYDVSFVADGQQAVSCGADGKIHVWKTSGSGSASGMSETPKDDKTIRMMSNGAKSVLSLTLDKNDHWVVAGSDKGSVDRFVIESGQHQSSQVGHTYPVHAVAYNATTDHLASGDYAGRVCVWDNRGELVTEFTAAPGYQAALGN